MDPRRQQLILGLCLLAGSAAPGAAVADTGIAADLGGTKVDVRVGGPVGDAVNGAVNQLPEPVRGVVPSVPAPAPQVSPPATSSPSSSSPSRPSSGGSRSGSAPRRGTTSQGANGAVRSGSGRGAARRRASRRRAALTAARARAAARRRAAASAGQIGSPSSARHEPGVARAVRKVIGVIPGPIKAALAMLALLAAGLAASTILSRRSLAAAEKRALTDALTGLANHRCAQETLHRMAAQAKRSDAPLASVLFDLDHFKQINDTHGHGKGDEVLAAVGAAIRDAFRLSDFAGRYGGEEFIVLLPDTDEEGARVAAEKLRETLAAIEIEGLERPITASFGVAVLPATATDPAGLLENADEALYSAKRNGRDRVETHVAPALAPALAS
jgi:diguanylate cyclase (GGDEF)-like protein